MNKKAHFEFARAALVALALVLVAGCSGPADAGDDTVRIQFSVDPAALEHVSSSAELMAALREGLSVEASSPLKNELTLQIGFRTFQSRSDGLENVGYDQNSPESITGSGIYLDIERSTPVNGRLHELRFHTFGDWSEDEAWRQFREKVESGLAYSLWSSGAFQPGADNVIPLKVDEVTEGGAVIEPDGTRMMLEITAQTLYRDGSKFGSREPPEGYQQSLKTVQIVLSPGAAGDLASEAEEPAVSAEPAAAEPSGLITGVYGIDNGRMIVDEIEGQLVFYNGNMAEPTHWPMSHLDGHKYFALYHDTPVEIRFSVDDEGRAFAMTIAQGGNEMKLPRKN